MGSVPAPIGPNHTLFTHILPGSHLEALRRLSLLHCLMAQPWGQLYADGMQILLTFTDIIDIPKLCLYSRKEAVANTLLIL